MTERLKEIKTSEQPRIGVWVEGDKVYRRDSRKHVSPTVYEPSSPEDLGKVESLAKTLFSGANMDHWTAQVEAQQHETLKELNSLLT